MPSSKSVNRTGLTPNLGLGFLSMPKANPLIKGKPDLMPANNYKF